MAGDFTQKGPDLMGTIQNNVGACGRPRTPQWLRGSPAFGIDTYIPQYPV